ncbi:DNA ligase [Nitrogeniibacter aestuarii]|uniref:DNA ligase n=1 Tax=Nitrogeniibacter aestuarii TaxID=2815343 RepID=UPI001D120FA6|nr:DNA ligase [Nitrogeniibacter aestuarii]
MSLILNGCRVLLVALSSLVVSPLAIAGEPLLLAREATEGIDPRPYLVSEKLDGVRAHWDGQMLRFRSGRQINAPAWFTDALPPTPLDGELWMGRGRFETVSGIVRTDPPDEAGWRQLRYMIFELPGGKGDFANRAQRIKALVAETNLPWLQAVEQRRVPDRARLEAWLAEVIDTGGEGLMLHRADAPYLTGRSDALLKLKPWQDAEGVVTAHLPGNGRLQGMLGALEVRLADGRLLRIGTGLSDAERRSPPALGAQITFRFRGYTRTGLPRFASFLRVRDPL